MLGIVGTDQRITASEMKTYDGIFVAPIPLTVLSAIVALVDCELPVDVAAPAVVSTRSVATCGA